MKFIAFPLLFSVAVIAYENGDRIVDQYNAAYPADPAKSAALSHCIAHNPNFNRLDADDRMYCYRQSLGTTAIAEAPTQSGYYAYSPSHLAGNDIRRQEANTAYRLPSFIASAAAAPARPPATECRHPRPPANAAASVHHPATTRHATAIGWQNR